MHSIVEVNLRKITFVIHSCRTFVSLQAFVKATRSRFLLLFLELHCSIVINFESVENPVTKSFYNYVLLISQPTNCVAVMCTNLDVDVFETVQYV